MVDEYRCPRGIESARTGPILMRVERVNPVMGPLHVRGYAHEGGRPTVRRAEFPAGQGAQEANAGG